MEPYRELLSRPRLSVISAELDRELAGTARRITSSVRVRGRIELEALFRGLLAACSAAAVTPKTLDLFGHSTASGSLLRLGDWVIDAAQPAVTAFFRELADHDVLSRLGIHAVRLLACKTAATQQGRSTICALADILGVEVFGTTHLLYDAHHDEHGFRDAWSFLLVAARDLRSATCQAGVGSAAMRWPRVLDVGALPALPLTPWHGSWPRRIATTAAATAILRLVLHDAGARMPGPPPAPACELALPSSTRDAYHIAHVLLDSAFLRFYPDGASAPGVVYPVLDARALRSVVDRLST